MDNGKLYKRHLVDQYRDAAQGDKSADSGKQQ
jgi:hypothetical protein